MDSVSAASTLTVQQLHHIKIMTAIVQAVADTPMILKGGTALLLAYELDRFSDDLDFDSHKRLRLESKIKGAVNYPFKLQSLDLLKNTETVTRYRLMYDSPHSQNNRLKIEISHRIPEEPVYQIINKIKVYQLPDLIKQKLIALENRTAARDLYDINFLANKYGSLFSNESRKKLKILLSDLNSIEKRFASAFKDDEILYKTDVSQMVGNLQQCLVSLEPKLSGRRCL